MEKSKENLIKEKIVKALCILEEIYLKNLLLSTNSNEKTKNEENVNQLRAFLRLQRSIFFQTLKRKIDFDKIIDVILNNPQQTKGFKLYNLILYTVKPLLNDTFNQELIDQILEKPNKDTKLTNEFKEGIKNSANYIRELTFEELKDIVKIDKEWRRFNYHLETYYVATNLEDALALPGTPMSYPVEKIDVTRYFIGREIEESLLHLNFLNPYKTVMYKESFRRKTLETYNKEAIAKWENLILKNLPKKLDILEIIEYMLEELKIMMKSRKNIVLEKILKHENFDKEQKTNIKKHYLETLDKLDNVKVVVEKDSWNYYSQPFAREEVNKKQTKSRSVNNKISI